MLVVTAEEMRRLDRLTIETYGTPGHVLMERAGLGATEVILERFPHVRGERVVVVAGKGNNGGDGFVIARALASASIAAEVVLLARREDVTGDAALALDALVAAGGCVVEAPDEDAVSGLPARLEGARLVVDAVFGTGLRSEVRGRFADAVHAINGCGSPVFAVDIPSGLDADRGVPLGVAVQAEATATFAFAKPGLLVYPGAEHVGELAIVDIGIALEAVRTVEPRLHWTERAQAASWVPTREADTHKGRTGHVLVVAGSTGRTGAARMAARAALRGGAGLVTLAGPASLNAILCQASDELMTLPLADDEGHVRFVADQIDAALAGRSSVVVGPGLGVHDGARAVVRHLVEAATVPLVIDADALTCVAGDLGMLASARRPPVLTPHPGEMARLIGTDVPTVQRDRIATARRCAAEHGCILVLKGSRTIVASPDGEAWINPTGNPGMATGGMGDVLAGLVGALIGQGLDAGEAARLAVYVHGDAADRIASRSGTIGMIAGDVIEELPPTLAALSAVLASGAGR